MAEIFKPRENMHKSGNLWECRDKNGHLICDGGPSIIRENGSWDFYNHTIGHHRLDGPAHSSGAWYIHDKNVTLLIHAFAIENDIDLDNLSDEDKVLIALKFG